MGKEIRTIEGMEGARRATGIPSIVGTDRESFLTSNATQPRNPEVPEKATRRRFTAEYKVRILRQAEACRGAGEIGVLLRREGLYSSHLTTWRRQRETGILSGLRPKRRGPKPTEPNPLQGEIDRLRKETGRLQKRLKQAELIIEVQKKISEILGIPLQEPSEKGGGA
jgi:transposase-like protein